MILTDHHAKQNIIWLAIKLAEYQRRLPRPHSTHIATLLFQPIHYQTPPQEEGHPSSDHYDTNIFPCNPTVFDALSIYANIQSHSRTLDALYALGLPQTYTNPLTDRATYLFLDALVSSSTAPISRNPPRTVFDCLIDALSYIAFSPDKPILPAQKCWLEHNRYQTPTTVEDTTSIGRDCHSFFRRDSAGDFRHNTVATTAQAPQETKVDTPPAHTTSHKAPTTP